MTDKSTDDKIAMVQYMRGFAALAVAWYHLTITYQPGFTRSSGGLGWLGVDVFFVISGFVLPLSIWRKYGRSYELNHFPEFLRRRIIRIEPPYLFSVALTAGLLIASAHAPGFAGTPYHISMGQLLSHIFYLPRVLGYGWLQATYWTLALEFSFYVLIGVIYAPLLKRPTFVLLALLGVVGAAAVAGPWEPRTLLFGVGVAVFLMRYNLISGFWACALSISFAVVAGIHDHLITLVSLLTGLIIHVTNGRRLPAVMHGPLTFLGAISYSVYIVHVPVGGRVVNLGARIASSEFERFLVSLIALLTTLAFAWFFYLIIERPFVNLSKKSRPKPFINLDETSADVEPGFDREHDGRDDAASGPEGLRKAALGIWIGRHL